MSNLPVSWINVQLGDVVDYGNTSKAEPREIAEDSWILELEDIEKTSSKLIQRILFSERQSKSTKNKFEKNDVLYGKLRPYLDKVIIANESGYCTTEIIPIKPGKYLDNRFLFYGLKRKEFIDYVSEVSHGLNMPRLGTKQGQAAPFVLAPLNEQIRIANKLDSVLAKVDAAQARLEKIPTLLKRFRQSVLAAATSGELTDGANWKRTTIDSLCESSFYGPRFSKTDYTIDGIPTIRTTDMTDDGKIVISDSTPRISVPDEKIEQFKVRKGDLLITRTGSIGVMAVFDDDYLALPSAYLIRFRFNHTVEVKFLYYFLTSPRGQELMGLGVTTVAQPNINAKTIRAIAIDLPSIEEQKEIVRRVESLFTLADTVEKQYLETKKRIDRLTQSLLAKAFRGELVPQDPNDEPAAELLKRIQAERNAQPLVKNKRKQQA